MSKNPPIKTIKGIQASNKLKCSAVGIGVVDNDVVFELLFVLGYASEISVALIGECLENVRSILIPVRKSRICKESGFGRN